MQQHADVVVVGAARPGSCSPPNCAWAAAVDAPAGPALRDALSTWFGRP
ncbi:hypothetical protein ACFPIJ_56260 [Dactylosporangium cerinum]|uniref:Uncharacterized protein n=1 Tax=Dactylosporangium cerinum TaxID=1434730 RepID=A0ABV9WIS2_9ACTN